MKTSPFMEEEQLITTAIDILIEKLGTVETNRFLALSPKRRMESVKRHQRWQSQLQKDEFFDNVFND